MVQERLHNIDIHGSDYPGKPVRNLPFGSYMLLICMSVSMCRMSPSRGFWTRQMKSEGKVRISSTVFFSSTLQGYYQRAWCVVVLSSTSMFQPFTLILLRLSHVLSMISFAMMSIC